MWGNPRSRAQRPLPSMMTATWWGRFLIFAVIPSIVEQPLALQEYRFLSPRSDRHMAEFCAAELGQLLEVNPGALRQLIKVLRQLRGRLPAIEFLIDRR